MADLPLSDYAYLTTSREPVAKPALPPQHYPPFAILILTGLQLRHFRSEEEFFRGRAVVMQRDLPHETFAYQEGRYVRTTQEPAAS